MPSSRDHETFGTLVGGIAGFYSCTRSQPGLSPLEILARVLGGGVGGRLGALAPDALEPATSSHHRSTMHSATVTLAVGVAGVRHAMPAADEVGNVDVPTSDLELALRNFLAGAIVGAPAGYVSHTVADAATPRGIPILF